MATTAQAIMAAVADAYGITLEDLLSHCRATRLATARAVTCHLLYRHFNLSTNDVGRMLSRSHAAVMHNCRKVQGFYLWPKMYETDLAIIKGLEEKYFSDEKMDTVGG